MIKLSRMMIITTALLVSCTLVASAQVVSGSLAGVVRDDQGALLVDARIAVTHLETGRSYSAQTNENGRFRLPFLPVGPYRLEANKKDYNEFVIERLRINLGSKDYLSLTLQPTREFSETITVSSAAPLIETGNSTVDTVVTSDVIDALPLFERDFLEVLTTLGGVAENSEDLIQADPGLNISGGRTRQNIFQVDGGSNTSAFDGKRQQFYNLDVIEEVQLSTANFNAEYGRGSGGVINVVTKSGTNELSGSFTYFLRDSDFNADSRNEWRYQEFSFLLGGPIVRDKLFFLLSASRIQREDIVAYELGQFSEVFTNETLKDDFHRNALFGKLTWYPSDSQILNVSANYEPLFTDKNNPLSLRPVRDGFTLETGGLSFNANYTWTLSDDVYSNSFLNVRTIENSVKRTNDDEPAVTDLWFITFIDDNGIPRSSVAAIGPLITGSTNEEFGVTFSENVNILIGEAGAGSHSITAGISYEYASVDAFEEPYDLYINLLGSLLPQRTRFSREFLVGDLEFSFDHQNISLFGQDSWQLNDNVTVNLGARADYDSFLENTNVSPRIGIAIDPTGKQRTVIRAGGGLYYASNFFELHRIAEAPRIASQVDFTLSGDFENAPIDIDPNVRQVIEGLQTPYTIEANIGAEHQLMDNLTTHIDFVWREMKDQFYTTYDNLPESSRFGPRPDPSRGSIITYGNRGEASYRSLTVGLHKRFADRWMMRANYTWSRARGNSSRFQQDLFFSPLFRTQQAQDAWINGEGPLAYDIPHHFKITGIYMLPWDVTVSAFYQYRSGYPISVSEDTFEPPIPINTERLPDYKQLDVRLYKAFRFNDQYKLAFFVDLINALNTENVIRVGTLKRINGMPNPEYLEPLNDNSFGVERETQIGIKIEF